MGMDGTVGENKIKCPICKGRKVRARYFAIIGGFYREVVLWCWACRGEGELTRERLLWLARGLELQELRESLGWSVKEAAEACGLDQVRYCDSERGRRDPDVCVAQLVLVGATG